MSKTDVDSTIVQRIGYGPVLVPPLLITVLFSFSFIFMESRMMHHASVSSTSAAEPIAVGVSSTIKIIPTLAMTDQSELPTLEREVTTSSEANPSNSVSPQPAQKQSSEHQPSTTNNSLQSKKYESPRAVEALLNDLTSPLKVKDKK